MIGPSGPLNAVHLLNYAYDAASDSEEWLYVYPGPEVAQEALSHLGREEYNYEVQTWRDHATLQTEVKVRLTAIPRERPFRPLLMGQANVLQNAILQPPVPIVRPEATRVMIDSQLRLGDYLTVVKGEDADGYLYVGMRLVVFDPVRELTGTGVVERIDLQADYAYIAVDWVTLWKEEG